MKRSQVGSRGLFIRFLAGFSFCLSITSGWVQAGTNITVITSVADLSADVDLSFTNSTLARVVLPGMGTYTNNLGVIAYTSAFESNFLAAFSTVTDNGIVLRPIEVCEPTTNSPRKRYYLSVDGIPAYTTTVSLANYPTNWIQSTYGTCPSWLTGAARTQWFSERDPSRQRIHLSLISTSDVPTWCAAMTNIGHSLPGSQTNMSFLQAYSNDIALAGFPATDGLSLLLHATTNTATLDLYRSTNLMDTLGWRLVATLDHVTDPLLFDWYGTDPSAFFTTGDPSLDTDADGLADVKEFFLSGTDPTLRDTVGDGIGDGTRILTYGFSATSADSDGDGLSDAYEIAVGLNPTSGDTDGDGLSDYAELVTYFGHTSSTNSDTDKDGLNDYVEVVTRDTYAAPYDSTDNDAADTDNDTLSDAEEINTLGTNPKSVDSDNDGMHDSFEVYWGLNPLNATDGAEDYDGDGFSNLKECQWKTDPTVSNGFPSSYYMISRGPGSNEIRRLQGDTNPHYVLAMGDLGPHSTLIRVPPQRFGTNMIARRVAHTGTSGFRINGVPASSVPSPIAIPASTDSTDFTITVDSGYAGADIQFTLQDTNGVTHGSMRVYSPKVTHAEFHAFAGASVNVTYGTEGNLWHPMSTDATECRIHVWPDTTPAGTYTSTRELSRTDWLLTRVYGPGATPSTTTLNELDWRSAYVFQSLSPRTRGIQLVPGVHTMHVGIDANANSELNADEIHVTCKVYIPRIDLTVDSDNDGSVTTNDNSVEDCSPGKLIFKDKDLQAMTGSNESDVVAMNVAFDVGGATVPEGCYGVLEWIPQSGYETVEVFLDATGTNQLSWTGFHPTYSNQTVRGHLFDAGDTVPSTLYLKASPYALAPIYGDDTITHGTVTLICYRRDTKTEVCRDTIKVSVANRPAVTPKNDKFYVWTEEQTDTNRYVFSSLLWDAVSTNLTTNGLHQVPYTVQPFRSVYTNLTPSDFTALADAGILVTAHHGGSGYVYAVAFPQTSTGYLDAQNWATTIGAVWTTNASGYNSHMVGVKSSYLAANWKPLRDANNAMYWAMCCSPAASNVQESLPSVLSAAGGAFNCGAIGTTYSEVAGAVFSDCLFSMRLGKWRTATGACYSNRLYAIGYTNVGHGRVTLWPAPLRNSTVATYPKTQNKTGVACLVLDTVMRDDSGSLTRLSGDARMVGTPQWILSGSQRCGLRWPYINDTSTYATRIRAISDKCLADPWIGDDKKKMLAGDGKTCGLNIEWEF